MKVLVQYTAQLRAAIGRSEEYVDLPDAATLRDLLVQLAAACEAAGSHLVTEAGEPRPSLLVVLNNIATPAGGAASIALRAGDTVTLLTPIAGG